MAGLINFAAGLGKGLEEAGKSAVIVGRDMLAQEAQQARDDRLEEFAARRQDVAETGMDRRQGVSETGQDRRQASSQTHAVGMQADQQAFTGEQGELNRGLTRSENELNRSARSAEHADTVRLREAEIKIHAAAEGRLAAGTKLDNEIKTLTLNNAKRVDVLRDEFKTATQERKAAINEEVQLLTGKDNDSYLPVPLKDDMGNVTGYKIFDKKRGGWVEDKAPSAVPQAAIDYLKKNPGTADNFRQKYKTDPAQYLDSAAPAAAKAPVAGIVNQRTAAADPRAPYYRPDLEAKDPHLASLRLRAKTGDTQAWIDYMEQTGQAKRAAPLQMR